MLVRQSRAERVLMALSCAAAPLLDCTDVTGRVGRRSFWSAMLLAAGLVAMGYAMDWFLFGSVQLARPDFFACFFGGVLALPLLTLGVRRLRDAGRNAWLMLLLFLPVLGWLLLARWWCAPSGSGTALARLRSRGCCATVTLSG
jgi:uncharacterized membrane protein YhaH (DUF805 family)